jgi:dihydroflavonol-4-reductase
MKSVFVTGINGLLGTNLTHQLLHQGYFVKGLVRDKSRYKGKNDDCLQIIEGDLFDDFTKVLDGVDYVVHAAALTCQNLLNYNDYCKINGNATIQLFHAAAKCKVRRFVFVSTANTIGYGSLDAPGSEEVSIREPFCSSYYAKSKKETEEYLLKNKHILATIIVNPTFLLGAYDSKPGSGKIVLMGWKRKIIVYPPGGKNFVHVEDVAQGIIKCFHKGRSGDKYILAGENLSYRDFFKRLNAVADQIPVMIQLPAGILMGIGVLGELLRRLGLASNLSMVNMKILCTGNYYSNKKSIKELGMTYRPVDYAIAAALKYFKNEQCK